MVPILVPNNLLVASRSASVIMVRHHVYVYVYVCMWFACLPPANPLTPSPLGLSLSLSLSLSQAPLEAQATSAQAGRRKSLFQGIMVRYMTCKFMHRTIIADCCHVSGRDERVGRQNHGKSFWQQGAEYLS